ncbi:hypothetical protein [Rhodovulum sp.]|uniref:hypothetical protein n=1 Tax=Rhodovulum sp. TaxID=34009 RepID=UPI0017F7E623|nr:hypothetical protein [Rhodovulum sp.]HDR27601.1 hypothetical protein [Rhodovulum sp.]
MRTSLPEICQTAHLAGLTGRNPPRNPVSRLPKRSGSHLGAAEAVYQTFLIYTLILILIVVVLKTTGVGVPDFELPTGSVKEATTPE